MPRLTISSESCSFRMQYTNGLNQTFPITFDNIELTDNGFETGTIIGHTNEQPTFVYVEYNDTYLAEEYPDSLGIVTYTNGEITIDCSTYSIKSVDLYDKILTNQEIDDRRNQSTFLIE